MSIAGHYLELIDDEGVRVDGESEGRGTKGWIVVTGWDWDVNDPAAKEASSKASKSAGGKRVVLIPKGKDHKDQSIAPAVFQFTKLVDRSSTRLLRGMEGKWFRKAKFLLREEMVPGDHHHRPFEMHVVLENVYIKGYQLSGRASEHRVDLEESWQLDYTHINIIYESQQGLRAEFAKTPDSDRGTSERIEPDVMQELKKLKADVEDGKKRQKG